MRPSDRLLIAYVVAVWWLTPWTSPRPLEVRGVIVESIAPGGLAEKLGIKVGDRLLTYDGKPLFSPLTLLALQQNTFDKKEVGLGLQRGGETLTLTVPVGSLGLQTRPELPPAALQLYEEGRRAQEAQKTDEAIAKWTAAAQATQAAGDKFSAAFLYRHVAMWHLTQRRGKEAKAMCLTAWELLPSSTPDAALQSRTLAALGECHYVLEEFDEAVQRYEQASAVNAAAGYEKWFADDLRDAGIVSRSQGQLHVAHNYSRRALEIYKRLAPVSLDVATVLNQLGSIHREWGRMAEAQDYHTRALSLCERIRRDASREPPHPERDITLARTLNSLGIVTAQRGHIEDAYGYCARALTILERVAPNSSDLANTLNNLGNISWFRADWDAARDYYTRALKIREALMPGSLEVATILNNIGSAAFRCDDLQTAHDAYARALAIFQRRIPQSLPTAMCLVSLGEVACLRGELPTAEDYVRRALAIAEKIAPQSRYVATTLNALGEVAYRRGDWKAARDAYTRALSIQERLAPDSIGVAHILHKIGATHWHEQRLTDALPLLQRAVDLIELNRRRIASVETRSLMMTQHTEIYTTLLEARLALNDPAGAFEVLERAHARSLVEMLAERGADFTADAPAELLQKQRELDKKRDDVYRRLSGLNSDKDTALIEQLQEQVKALAIEQRQLANEIRRASPQYAALQYPQPLNLQETQGELEEGTLLLAYWVDKNTCVLFSVSRTELQVHRLPVRESDLRDRIGKFRAALVQRGDFRPLARDLYDVLLRPAQAQIDRAERVLICPDGPLHTLPFAALVERGSQGREAKERYVVEAKPLHVAASMSVYAELRKAPPPPNPPTAQPPKLLALGDPVYEATTDAAKQAARDFVTRGGKLTPLPHTRQELQAIQSLYGKQATIRLGKDASETAVKREATQARIIHFACHGILDDRNPLGSALALSAEEEQEDGFLRAYEILEKVRLDADLVVLSACQSGLGAEMKNEGIVGMTRAFQFAGAKNVMVSLWEIMDKSTAQLMAEFYRHLKAGKRKDEALQQAQVKLLKDSPYRHPYYWAPFVLVGNGR
ncbi:MAG: CHAT domain-containing protein [Abditibacteriales bacterium]|nr:CHAT domain-containing protein [Abditibacteriales bacterium]MDW8366109.1 CHAT domain-containing protein [Abditibacteriales bacterium]